MKLLLITHGNLAEGLIHSATMLVGKLINVDYISFKENMGIDELTSSIQEYFAKHSEEILVFTDILGGTPFNIASLLTVENNNVKIIYGVNLPIFIECYMNKDIKNINELVEHISRNASNTIGLSEI